MISEKYFKYYALKAFEGIGKPPTNTTVLRLLRAARKVNHEHNKCTGIPMGLSDALLRLTEELSYWEECG